MKSRAAGVLRSIACGVAVGLLASPAAASPIPVSGSSAGCFGAACDTFGESATYGLFGLEFSAGDPFAAWTDGAGALEDIVLGTLSRGNVQVTNAQSIPFNLLLSFTLPGGIGDEIFAATIAGTNPGGGGPLAVDFDNQWRLIGYADAFGAGSFELALSDLTVNKNGESTIFGDIRNASYTASVQSEVGSAVPEPASILLFGLGMMLAARRLRARLGRNVMAGQA